MANTKKYKNSQNKYKGIHIIRGKYITARIQIDGKQIHLGMFLTETEAAHAYNAAAIKYFGEYAQLNEIF
ncbi:hypothetical protein ES708_08013 [subsurface metagenome]